MWPFSTVTDPKRLSRPNACSESSVPQPHSGYTVHSGTCAKSTIGVLLARRGDIVLQPRDLLGAERPESAGLEVQDVHEADEMHAGVIEAVPAPPFVPLP